MTDCRQKWKEIALIWEVPENLFHSLFQFFDAELFFIAGDEFSGAIVFEHKNLKT